MNIEFVVTPGRIAYEKWRELVYSPTFSWDALPASGREGWEEVARAVIEWTENEH